MLVYTHLSVRNWSNKIRLLHTVVLVGFLTLTEGGGLLSDAKFHGEVYGDYCRVMIASVLEL